ncbi:thiamine pyrophosphokinase [Mucilaginibacter sp. PAMB04274]|uniref:thiamine pyrophosphokinase n=1 Tax=Mucilaginibacter sp. PAMB04274 TaxID=3138568 RepID=UPI0031F6FA9D
MSSHHIVREKQEPALLIVGLSTFTDEELGQLLEWSPTVIATLPVAEQLAVYGIKIDYIVSDEVSGDLQSDVQYIHTNGQSWLQAAFHFLVTKGYPAVNVVADELDLRVYESYVAQINVVIFYKHQKIYAITSGFRKWKPAGETVTLLTVDTPVSTEGLQQLSAQAYQTQADGFISLTFDAPSIFIAEVY